MAHLTSLLEVTVTSPLQPGTSITVAADIEPSFLALGPFHLALGMNNRAWFYLLGETNVDLLRDREYLGTVTDMQLNADYCAVKYEGKIQLHVLESEGVVTEERESKIFPETGKSDVISCMALTSDFLVWGTDMGGIGYFFLEDWSLVSEFKHITGIKEMVAEASGTKIAFIDSKNQGYVYNPNTEAVVAIRDMPETTKALMWDQCPSDRDILVSHDGSLLTTFILDMDSVAGPSVSQLGTTKIPQGQHPVLLFNGELSLQTQSGKLVKLVLSTHDIPNNVGDFKPDEMRELLRKNLALGRFSNGWAICEILAEPEAWETLAKAALEKLEVDFAVRVYRNLKDVSKVWSLEETRDIEDRKLLSGHLAMMLGDYQLAQDLYLQSSQPVEALHMRRDLLQWEQALSLAARLAPGEMATISREYATQLEFTGDYPAALQHYERGLVGDLKEDSLTSCRAGIARTALRCGDVRKGLGVARELGSRSVFRYIFPSILLNIFPQGPHPGLCRDPGADEAAE